MSLAGEMLTGGIGCAILAAGRSERLGRPKQLVLLHGTALVRRIAQTVLSSDFAGCALVTGCQAPAVERAVDGLALDLLPNPDWEEGMASSIRVAAHWAQTRGLSALALTTCDQWRLSTAHLAQLLAALSDTQALAGSQYANTLGVPAVFGSAWFTRLQGLAGDRGAGALLQGAAHARRVPWPEGADDLDTEADLAKACASED
jgi:molybdenum cofactor cytidylyltransferase